ncbi:MAG: iron ABC transporter permease [Pseudomonadota bacterium]
MTEAVWQKLDGTVTFLLPLRAVATLVGLLLAIAGITLVALMSGSFPMSAGDALRSVVGNPPSDMALTVVWEFRLPRALAAAMAGALLAGSGAVLQTVTRNALADPSLVGVSQGAGLAVVTVLVLYPETPFALRPVFAFVGALFVAALIQAIALRRAGDSTMRFILTGIGVAAFLGAVTQTMFTYGDLERAMAALAWLAGSVQAAGWADVQALALSLLVLIPALVWCARPLAALRMGPEIATGLGANVRRDGIALITLSVALAASAVAIVGPIGFVGLIAPHLAKRLARCGPGLHLALSLAAGAALVAGADLVGRTTFAPTQVPAGLVTAVIGAPVFGWLLMRKRVG